ncbi:hypothetical protein [Tepidiforma sp.]|uniref:hypothetical protein n=1 Tax=Tepidiforma sp. TaxID=2682230 RepID=UPI002ADDF6FD|nr:hypothetical protein [Tepidiforma sp.]
MTGAERNRGGTGGRWMLAAALLFFCVAGYVGAMRATVGLSLVESDADAARRDLVYSVIHVGLLVGAAMVGFVTGKWVNGLGLAFAVLFVVVLATAMVGLQVVTFEVACSGGPNGLIRHWHC